MRAAAAVSRYLATVRGLNRNVRLVCAYSGMGAFGIGGLAFLLSNLYLLRLGYGPEFIGLANALLLLAMGGMSLPAGELGRRFTNRRMMIAGAMLLALAYIALALSWLVPGSVRSTWVLLQFLLVGAGFTFPYVNSAPFLAGWTGDDERDHAFSVFSAVITACGFLGALVGGQLPGLFARALGLGPDDPIPYGLGVLAGGAVMALAALVLLPGREPGSERAAAAAFSGGEEPEPGAGEQAPWRLAEQAPRRLAEQAPWRTIGLLSLVLLASGLGLGVVSTFYNVFFDQALHASTATIGALAGVSDLFGVSAALAAPLIMARLGRPRTYTLGLLAGAASIASLGLATGTLWAAASFIVRGLASYISSPAISVIQQTSVLPRWRSLMSGAGNMAATIGQAIVAFGGGYVIAAFGYRPLFLASAAIAAVAAMLFWAWFGKGSSATVPATPVAAAR